MPRSALCLAAFMDQETAVSYFTGNCVWKENTVENALHHWEEATGRLRPVPWESGLPNIQDVPADFREYVSRVPHYPMFAANLDSLPTEFKLVEIDPLLAFQYHVLDDVGDNHCAAFARDNNPIHIYEATLPVAPQLNEAMMTQEQNAITVSAHSLNLRILGPFQGNQDGIPLSGFGWDFNFPHVQVVRYQGRCYLKNGYHRCAAFRRLGVTHIPCLFQEATTYEQTGAARVGFFPEALMTSETPPTVGHFARDIAYPVQMRGFIKIIRIAVTEMVIPADKP